MNEVWSPNRFRPMTVTKGAWKRLSSHTPWSKMPMSNPGVPYPSWTATDSRLKRTA